VIFVSRNGPLEEGSLPSEACARLNRGGLPGRKGEES